MMYTKRFDFSAAFRFAGTFDDCIGDYREKIASVLFGYICGTEAEFGIEVHWAEIISADDEGPEACVARIIVKVDGHCDDTLDLEGFLSYLKNHKACSVRDFESNHLADGHDDSATPFWFAELDDKPYYERHNKQWTIPE